MLGLSGGILLALIFGLFDYLGFNLALRKKWTDNSYINPYRIIQFVFQCFLSAAGLFVFGWLSVVIFLVLWWTFVCDHIFYLFAYIIRLNPSDKNDFRNQILNDGCYWAHWTPWGLIKCRGKICLVTGREILIQSLFGILLSLILAIMNIAGII